MEVVGTTTVTSTDSKGNIQTYIATIEQAPGKKNYLTNSSFDLSAYNYSGSTSLTVFDNNSINSFGRSFSNTLIGYQGNRYSQYLIDTVSGKSDFEVVAQTRVKNPRQKLPNSDLKKYGNMATADVDIPGIKTEFYAHSKITSSSSKGSDIADFSYLKSENERSFSSYMVDGYPRYHDTEAKILEDIASQINDPNAYGTINLFTEKAACQSCTNVILEFRRKFPNIKLNVFTGE